MTIEQQTISIEVHQDSPVAIDCCELALEIKRMANNSDLRVFNGRNAAGEPVPNLLRVIYSVKNRADLAPIEFDIPAASVFVMNPQQIAQGILGEIRAEIQRRINSGELH